MNSRLEVAGEWLLRLREDSLSDGEMSEWIAWCEADPQNLAAFEELQSLWRAAGEHSPAGSLALREAKGSEDRSRWHWPMAASLGALLLVGAALSIYFTRAEYPRAVANAEVVRTPVAANRQATLPDGTQVDLGARSVLDVDFTPSRRQLQLRDGQAFFQVKPDKSRPFVIDAGDLTVVAVGTAFDVRRTPEQIAVTVQEGAVKITAVGSVADSQDTQSRSLLATARYQLVFNTRSKTLRKSLVDPAVALSWRYGRLEFTGDPLDVVIASVNRYSALPVVLEDATLGTLTFTGTVFVDSIEASLDALGQVFPLTVQRDRQRIVLVRRQ